MSRYHISGFPITNHGWLVGILTNRDVRFATHPEAPVSHYMTSQNLVTAPVGTSLEEAKAILHGHRIEKLPLVDDEFNLRGLITYKDILKKRDFPHHATMAAAGCWLPRPSAWARVGRWLELLLDAGVDAVAVDTAHGHSASVLQAIRRVKMISPDLPVLAGNVVTAEGTEAFNRGRGRCDQDRCRRRFDLYHSYRCRHGVPRVTAIAACAKAARPQGIPIIADGGIKYSGDIVKALAAGANAVMLGSLLAGLEESPGDMVIYEGRRFKEYRGMGPFGAMKGRADDRYATAQGNNNNLGTFGKLVPEGIEGQVPFKGSLSDYMFQLMGGLRSGMGYVGAADLEQLLQKARFARITNAGLIESHPHSVFITKEAPNYQGIPR